MLIQTTLIQADRRSYDPNLADINFRDNFNISVVKLKKTIKAISLIDLLKQPDDMVDGEHGKLGNVFNVLLISQ